MLKPDSGSAAVDGFDTGMARRDVQRRIGVLADSRGLYPRLTSREHIRYFGQLQAVEPAVLERRTDELIQQLDMGGIADRRAEGFSHGERMKVSRGRALVHAPGTVSSLATVPPASRPTTPPASRIPMVSWSTASTGSSMPVALAWVAASATRAAPH